MPQGFENPSDELKTQVGVRRLIPSAKRGDLHAFADGVRELQRKYGRDVADEAMRRTMELHPVVNGMIDVIAQVSPAMKQEVYARSLEIMAEVLEKSSLRLEDHMRVTDEGIALTKEAVEAIAATGFHKIYEYGKGNDSLEGVGIDRTDGFVHPLSEVIGKTEENGLPEDCLNLWFCISLMISVAQGWTKGNKESSLEMLRECVGRSAPTASLEMLMRRSRYDDRVLLQLCNLAHSGLDAKAKASLGL